MPRLSNRQWAWIGITFAIYAVLAGWPFALALVISVGFHEYCHLLMAHKLGMETEGFTMIPFVGGLAYVSSKYKNLWDKAKVLFAGPIGGGALALLTFVVYLATGVPFFAAVAFWMAALNLFNLLPLSFLDGGQLMGTVTFSINRKIGLWINIVSTVLAAALILYANPVLGIFVGILGAMQIRKEYRNQKLMAMGFPELCSEDFRKPPLALTKKQMLRVVGVWVATFLILGSFCLSLYKSPLTNISILTNHSAIGDQPGARP